jgi:hypothetical protein
MTRFAGMRPVLFLIAVFFGPFILNADIAPLQVRGGAVATKSPHETIRMESEEVVMRLGKRSYTVEAVFRFYNYGETTTEWIGFPKGNESLGAAQGNRPPFSRPLREEQGEERIPDFIRFHGWVNGMKASFSEEGKRWMARHVTFPAGAITTIRVAYEADYYRGGSAVYIVGTGSCWKDSIGRAAFTVDGSAVGGSKHFTAHLNTSQSHELLSENALRIEVTDYKPDPKAALSVTLSRAEKRL